MEVEWSDLEVGVILKHPLKKSELWIDVPLISLCLWSRTECQLKYHRTHFKVPPEVSPNSVLTRPFVCLLFGCVLVVQRVGGSALSVSDTSVSLSVVLLYLVLSVGFVDMYCTSTIFKISYVSVYNVSVCWKPHDGWQLFELLYPYIYCWYLHFLHKNCVNIVWFQFVLACNVVWYLSWKLSCI